MCFLDGDVRLGRSYFAELEDSFKGGQTGALSMPTRITAGDSDNLLTTEAKIRPSLTGTQFFGLVEAIKNKGNPGSRQITVPISPSTFICSVETYNKVPGWDIKLESGEDGSLVYSIVDEVQNNPNMQLKFLRKPIATIINRIREESYLGRAGAIEGVLRTEMTTINNNTGPNRRQLTVTADDLNPSSGIVDLLFENAVMTPGWDFVEFDNSEQKDKQLLAFLLDAEKINSSNLTGSEKELLVTSLNYDSKYNQQLYFPASPEPGDKDYSREIFQPLFDRLISILILLQQRSQDEINQNYPNLARVISQIPVPEHY